MKTPTEIEKLKAEWRSDPCWDIEETEGFEDHKEGLLTFHSFMKNYWKRLEANRLAKKAAEMGIPGNLVLAAYIERLERQITTLSEIIEAQQADKSLADSVAIWGGKS